MKNIMYIERRHYVSVNEYGYRFVDLVSRDEKFCTFDDVECLVFDNLNSFFSSKVVSESVKHHVGLMFCDEKHSPIVYANSVLGQENRLAKLSAQTKFSTKMKKRSWRKIVISKINNQADCLMQASNDLENANLIRSIGKNVVEDDIHNCEAYAARKYFPIVFGKDFKRGRYADLANSCLNYGYSLIRGAIRRRIVVCGLEPSFGIHHNSSENPFNLSDDLIEPFRPFVDMIVFEIIGAKDIEEFDFVAKKALFQVFFERCVIDDKVYMISDAINVVVDSFVKCVSQNSVTYLKLPAFIEGGR
ncbi:CRISPR-associated endonuclease Cas1, NMENI subtype [Ligilactobacillus acidipiscis DSM 15836]|uniref:CRISPR-associated endonuclease Cas1, NMENI subtype n=1 Tax=Ligilactobacillus acidipiscis DSM 15836 TaxID=1423716 RepID=A0ABR5PJT6_9LACO|nr:type II CRISPR-associated endonuclease Cas1 [Ligilactobacillus acidipiscis]KRM27529.1 CRISPR-associated endonuclease Cas1, NMENI subtype [Ligilactobacillus acidipiscis DSM 15836]GAW64051.1 CRISPR-associated protein Cas1 [Ligilactobacillus acidipiscis]GEN21090.1 CRISPR-associated endonuclease Cas1 [Ligilactobacillus acidipiscis]